MFIFYVLNIENNDEELFLPTPMISAPSANHRGTAEVEPLSTWLTRLYLGFICSPAGATLQRPLCVKIEKTWRGGSPEGMPMLSLIWRESPLLGGVRGKRVLHAIYMVYWTCPFDYHLSYMKDGRKL